MAMYAKIVGLLDSINLARKHPWDRNPVNLADTFKFAQSVAAGTGASTGFDYTVPSGKIVFISTMFLRIDTPIATDGSQVFLQVQILPSGSADWGFLGNIFMDNDKCMDQGAAPKRDYWLQPNKVNNTWSCPTYAFEGDEIRLRYRNQDTVAHWMQAYLMAFRFDAL